VHKTLFAGLGRLILLVGVIALFWVGLPIVQWFIAAAVILAFGIFAILRLLRKLHPDGPA
jgi:hypothetical protein